MIQNGAVSIPRRLRGDPQNTLNHPTQGGDLNGGGVPPYKSPKKVAVYIILYNILICLDSPKNQKKLLLVEGFRGPSPFKTLPYALLIIWNLVKPGEVDENVEKVIKNVP